MASLKDQSVLDAAPPLVLLLPPPLVPTGGCMCHMGALASRFSALLDPNIQRLIGI
jgi:hypothetical protein